MKGTESRRSAIKEMWASRRRTVKPKAIGVSQEDLVNVGFLEEGSTLPLVVQPKVKDVDLFGWVRSNATYISKNLLKYGGILFRGFGLSSQQHFEQFLEATGTELMHYMEGATPRTEMGEKVYTSTEFPPERTISIHNELCYVMTWPMKIFFYCIKAPEQGGETPIGDVRKVYKRIAPEIRARFEEKGWKLLRNFGTGFGPRWETAYHVSDKASLESYFRNALIDFEWLDDKRLRTTQVRPAVATHPVTGETVWFTHVGFWHLSSLEPGLRHLFESEFGEEGAPFHTYYGDGSVIDDAVIDHLREAYETETVAFSWQEGDVLMLDNMLVAHGRRPFSGTRLILTAMGEPHTRPEEDLINISRNGGSRQRPSS